MKVFIVKEITRSNYAYSNQIFGVFARYEEAEECMKQKYKEHLKLFENDNYIFEIVEHEVKIRLSNIVI